MINLPEKGISDTCRAIFFSAKLILLLAVILSFSSCSKPESRWLRGNMHTHTFWSDGDDFPEAVARWYKDKGYDFLVHTDHNMILEGERWRTFPADNPTLLQYIKEYGKDWAEMKPDEDNEEKVQVRLKTLEEFRSLYEEPEKFLLIMGNEISNPHAVHLLAFEQDRVIPAVSGSLDERESMIRETVISLAGYRSQTGINTWPVLAHPNFRWAITAEMMIGNPDLRFFEVYNGHPQVNNDGDEFRAGTDRIWDIVLANRLATGGKLLYGLATDDTHNYHSEGASPGKGWVMVRSDILTPEAVLNALDRGDFYASTGVRLKELAFNGKRLKVTIDPTEGTEYLIEFIGTIKGFDNQSQPAVDADGNEIENTTRIYTSEIGTVLKEYRGLSATYKFNGDELYVRARITSTADQVDPNSGRITGKQKAWIQPHVAR